MNSSTFLGLVQNAALLAALVLVFDTLGLRIPRKQFSINQIPIGLIVGVLGIAVMTTSWELVPGAIFDTRSVLLGISGLFFGLIPTLFAIIATSLYRIYLGGSGVITGVLVIIATGTLGLVWRHIRKHELVKIKWKELYLFGFVLHLVMLALMLTFPKEVALSVITKISIPVIVIYPLATTLIGILMVKRLQRDQETSDLMRLTARLNETQSLSKIGGWEWDVPMQNLFWSDEVYRIHGLSPNEFIPNSADMINRSLSCYGPTNGPIIQAAFQNCIEKGIPYSLEVPFTNYQGEQLMVRTQAEAVYENGKIVRVLGNILDITESKNTEKLLKESHEVAQAILNASTESVFLMDSEGIVLAANETTAVRLGSRVTDLIGKSIYDFLPSDTAVSRKKHVAAVIKEGKPLRFEDERFGVWIENSIYPIFELDGNVRRVAIYGRDISEKKEMEYALANEADFNQRVFNSSNNQMAVLDSEGVILAINEKWRKFASEIAGLDESTSGIGARYFDQLKKLWRCKSVEKEGLAGILKVQHGELPSYSLEYPFHGSGGKKYWFQLQVVPLQGKKGCVLVTHSEITERKLAEEAQRRSETFFRTIFEKTSVGYSLTSMDGIYSKVNPTFSSMLGYPVEEMIGKNWVEFTYPDDIQGNKDLLSALLNDEKNSIIFEKRYFRKDGSILDTLISISLLRDDKDAPLYFLTNILDISEYKKLLKERERLSSLVDKSPASITIHNSDGKFLYANEKTFKLHGYSRDEFMKLNVHQLDVPESEALLELRIRQVMQDGEASFEVSHFRKDGSTIPLQVYARISDYEGEQVIESIAIDLTERKEMEQALRESEERYKSLRNASFGGITIHDKGIILECNQGLSDLTGYSRSELIGMDGLLLIAPNSRDLVRNNISIGYEKSYEAFGIRKNGELFPLRLEARNIPYKGKMVRSVEFRDISEQKLVEEKIKENQAQLERLLAETEHSRQALLSVVEDQKETEEQIQKLNDELEERVRDRTAQLESANKELEAFSYSVSHDLRAPLRGIDGWSLALEEDYHNQLDEKGRGYINRIRGEAEKMGHLIEDLLRLSRITRMDLKKSEIDLTDYARKITDRFNEENQNRVNVVIQGGLTVNGDPNLLAIVLENLFSNAFKFSSKIDNPLIEFGSTIIDEQVTYFIRDNGAGFEMDYAKNLFGAFQRMHKQADFPGTGVGLAIVQRIINRHGGKIWAEAKVNEGATFFFTLLEDR